MLLIMSSFFQKLVNATKNHSTQVSHKLQNFDELLGQLGHCTFVSIRSYHVLSCKAKHKEIFCNQLTQTVQQKYGSTFVSIFADSSVTLFNIRIGALPIAMRRNT